MIYVVIPLYSVFTTLVVPIYENYCLFIIMFMKKAHMLYVDRQVEDKNSKRFCNKINISELVQHIEI